MLAEGPLDELLFQVALCDDGRDFLLIRLILLQAASQVNLKLGVLFRIVSKNECFSWFDGISKPGTKLIIIYTRL